MGYDMRWVDGPDPDETTEIERLSALRNTAWKERDALPKEESGRWNPSGCVQGDPVSEYVGGSERWRAAQTEVSRLRDEYSRAEKSYFRLNIFAMGRYREYMWDLAMIHDKGEDGRPEWPDVSDYGLSWDDDPDPYESGSEAAQAWRKAHDAVLAYAPEVPGIPIWKFGSNDGWIVSPVECLGALDAWEKAGCPNPAGDDYWLRWIDFLRGAATHGGFEVH